jgi:hypothetical membrane protein
MTADEPDSTTKRLLACGLVAPVIAVGAFLAAAARIPDYDHVADTISKLSAQGVSGRWFWTIGLSLYAVLMGCFAAGSHRRFGHLKQGRILAGALVAHALLMGGVALFRDDLRPGGFFTVEGAVHDVLSGMAFSALVLAMLGAWPLSKGLPAGRPLRSVTLILGATMTAVGIAFLFTPPEVQGVPQRVFVGLAALWICVFAVQSGRSLGGNTGK